MKNIFSIACILCSSLFVFISGNSLLAQAGSLDPQFGTDGSGRRFILDHNLFFVANKTLEMPDGKILISGAGAMDNGNEHIPFVGRLLPNGDTDVSFADAGFILNEAPVSFDNICRSLVLQPDGKMLQSGRYYNLQTGKTDLYIMRYLEDGFLDETFGVNNNGMVFKTIPGFSIRFTTDLILQPDGKIVAPGSKVAPSPGASTLMYFRYLSDGKPDPDFGTNGLAEIDLGYFKQNTGYLELLPDGKILGAGNITSDQSENQGLIVRVNPDGKLDETFGNGGNTLFDFGSINQVVSDLAVTADGHILVAGYAEDINGSTGLNFALARFNSDGSLDESFGDGGYRFLDAGTGYDVGTSIDIQPDGKILFAGVNNSIGFPNAVVFRLNADGTTDGDFGNNGMTIIEDEVYTPRITVQSNGTALISGQGQTTVFTDKPAFYIARMLLDLNVGVFDSPESNMATMFYPNPVKDQTLLEYELLKDQYVEATIYTRDGTQVATCLPRSRQTAGKHKEQLNIAPDLPAGNYVLKITADQAVKTVRFTKI